MVIELTSEDQSKLQELASLTHRSETEIVSETMHWFLASQGETYAEAIAKGDEDFENGDYVEHDEVVASFRDVLRHL